MGRLTSCLVIAGKHDLIAIGPNLLLGIAETIGGGAIKGWLSASRNKKACPDQSGPSNMSARRSHLSPSRLMLA